MNYRNPDLLASGDFVNPKTAKASDIKFELDGYEVQGTNFLDIDGEITTDATMACFIILKRKKDGWFTTAKFTPDLTKL